MNDLNIEQELNEEQCAAVMASDGPVLVIAAAGTGKTRTLTYRVAHLVQSGVPAGRILLLTFTNRAAQEMMERARQLVGEEVNGLWGGTFHHVANRLLRRHANALGYHPDYTILDSSDSEHLVKTIVTELGVNSKHFPKASVLQSLFSLAANKCVDVEYLAMDHFGEHTINIANVMDVYNEFCLRKRRLNAMDFDDMLVNALELFKKNPDICAMYQEQFLHVLVDEFQDTNLIQGEWVDLLAAGHRNLLVVGDDFQSIYSWRGANYRNILNFPDKYTDAQVYKLETNYRSTPDILDIANACIAGNPEQFQKNLRSMRPHLMKPKLLDLRSGYEQASTIISEIKRLTSDGGYTTNDIVVLYRSHFHAMEMQMELTKQGIDFQITSGQRFFESSHVKDVCTLVRLAGNSADELAFRRLLGLLPRVGEKTASKIWYKLEQRMDLWNPVLRQVLMDALPKATKEYWRPVHEMFDSMDKEDALAKPHMIMKRFVDAFYDNYAIETFENYARRLEDVEALITFASQFDTLQSFLHEMALQTNLDAEASQSKSKDEGGGLRLTTIHQAKGLEWPVVFILWVCEGMFPSSKCTEDHEKVAEERRLFYVAVTRAKDHLYLCRPSMRRMPDGSIIPCPPSRFINEIDPSLLNVRKAARRW